MAQIIFVGGDSHQERAVSRLVRKGALEDLDVVFHHPTPWSRTWDKSYDAVKRNISSASALVITTDVPTELGRSLRRLARARGVRWFGVRARGEAGVLRALEKAATLAAKGETQT